MSKREDVIYGKKTGDYKNDTYVEIWLRDEDNGFGICYQHDARGCVWHFLLREADKYNEVKSTLHELICGIDNPPEVYDTLVEYFSSDDMYEYLDDEPEYEEPPMRTEEEIHEYMDEAFDRVWLVRKQNMFVNMLEGTESIQADILDGCLKAIDRVCDKYNIDFKEPVSDWDYGYWSGILAALRWVMGDEKDFLDT